MTSGGIYFSNRSEYWSWSGVVSTVEGPSVVRALRTSLSEITVRFMISPLHVASLPTCEYFLKPYRRFACPIHKDGGARPCSGRVRAQRAAAEQGDRTEAPAKPHRIPECRAAPAPGRY